MLSLRHVALPVVPIGERLVLDYGLNEEHETAELRKDLATGR